MAAAAEEASTCGAVADGGKEVMTRPVRKRPTKCHKCSAAAPAALLRGQDGYCPPCLMEHVGRRVRMDIAKHKLLTRLEPVAVAHSGGNRSCALLHLLRKYMQGDQKHPMSMKPFVLYVDESAAYPPLAAPRPHFDPAALPHALGFDFEVVLLESAFETDDEKDAPATHVSAQPRDPPRGAAALRQMMDSVKTDTAREDLIAVLRRRVLAREALRRGATKLMVGDCNDTLGVAVLTSVSLGRGGSMTEATAFSTDIGQGVTMMRPLRSASAREVGYYLHYAGLNAMPPPRALDMSHRKASIARLTQDFVAGLVAEYPTTARSIVRASEKVEMNVARVDGACALCGSPVEEATHARAMRTSQQARSTDDAVYTTFQQAGGAPINVASRLCHACRNTVDEMAPQAAVLPAWVLHNADAREAIEKYVMSEIEDGDSESVDSHPQASTQHHS